MKVVIMGCSRVGAQLAVMMDAEGHKVTIMDVDPFSFKKLPSTFNGTALVGNGLDEESLKKADIGEADVFVAVTQGDNRNVLACQIAKHIYNVPKVVCYQSGSKTSERPNRRLGETCISSSLEAARSAITFPRCCSTMAMRC
jgi:trk system potassium uptake protein TrkA